MKPMLFNGDMVRAILGDRKTVMRRVMKPQPVLIPNGSIEIQQGLDFLWLYNRGAKDEYTKAPYQPGDILYVRETFRIDYLSNNPGSGRIHYKADDTYSDFTFDQERYDMMRRAQLKPGWRPNENMPREAARIFLRVTGVRVERLLDITNDDMVRDFDFCPDAIKAVGRDALAGPLWNTTIKPADHALYGWDANPWVWVIEFERCEKPEGD